LVHRRSDTGRLAIEPSNQLLADRDPARNKVLTTKIELFDSHFHIIDSRYPLIRNNGYLPDEFTHQDYRKRLSTFHLAGGAIISGSFQGFDQSYLLSALKSLGPKYVGVTQLPNNISDDEIIGLNSSGVRALRFNLYRGDPKKITHITSMAKRVHELANWHIELYLDSTHLEELFSVLMPLPAVCIDHLGMKKEGFHHLLKLAERGHKVKATGFGRIDFDPSQALKLFHKANPDSLLFGTDLPSTRSPIPFQPSDINIILESLSNEAAKKVLKDNAIEFYKIKSSL
jgi:predicted TIM-barrel fold metal-dependent hydrolase